MKFVDEVELTHKKILLRVDFNVSLNPNHSISNDERIRQSIPTIEFLLKQHNKLILVAHLGEPEKRNPGDSLIRVAKRLHEYLPENKVTLVDDFIADPHQLKQQEEGEIILLENIRFYPGEQKNDPDFSGQLASLADVYVNDAFGVSHRKSASVIGVPQLLPSYGGLLLKKEVEMIDRVMKHPRKPLVAIIGGKKISTKIKFIAKLTTVADTLILGGGLANTFLVAKGHELGNSLISEEDVEEAEKILHLAQREGTTILLPADVVVGDGLNAKRSSVRRFAEVKPHDQILDIGPETEAIFGAAIDNAGTVIWNGPVGYMENPVFKRGTDFLYYAITKNPDVISVVGGGDTLAAIANKDYLDKITHISTGGGAMLEFIENGTLPGIEALKR